MKKKVNNVNDALIDLRNAVHEKEIVQNENPSKQLILSKTSLTLINNKRVIDVQISYPRHFWSYLSISKY